jgi:hypothetical protein
MMPGAHSAGLSSPLAEPPPAKVKQSHDNKYEWNEPGQNAPGENCMEIHTRPLGIAERTTMNENSESAFAAQKNSLRG